MYVLQYSQLLQYVEGFLEFLVVFQNIFYSTISRGTLSDILQNPSWEILLHCLAARSLYSQWLVTLLIAAFLLILLGSVIFKSKLTFEKDAVPPL